MTEWKITKHDKPGDRTVTVEEVVSALGIASSCVSKELEFNDIIKGTPKAKELYSDAIKIFALLKDKFIVGTEAAKKAKGPRLTAVRKRIVH